MSEKRLRIMVSRHSAFYSPLIAVIAAGFLEREGVQTSYDVLPPGGRSHPLLQQGQVDVMQSAPGSNWGPLERGESGLPVHFALVNRRDGFFLAGRERDDDFHWEKLEGAALLADHGRQPLLMLRYAAHGQGVDWSKVDVIDAGEVDAIGRAFREGRGRYVHQQGPAPQQLEHEGLAAIVAAVGAAMPEVAFSTLMATERFLGTSLARIFTRAYRQARQWAQQTDPVEIAAREAPFFEGIAPEALAAAIRRYQQLGCWSGDIAVTRELYGQALEVFLHGGAISRRHPYEQVIVAPPE
jgi:NitT/TauT family transport system substrate-binding protein